MNETDKCCVLYVRVSTTDQGERYSLPSQLKALREKAAREGYTVREDWIFTDMHTGKVVARPGFDRLNALVRTGAVPAVYIYSVDRFARRTEDALRLAREYKHHGAKLDFVEAPYEDTPTGRFTFTQLAAFSELWGEKILADSARGRKEKLRSGKLTHGSTKYGYIYIPKNVANGARLEIDPAMSSVAGITKQQVVEDVFRWRRGGLSMYGIAKRLNGMGILSAGWNGKPGGLWSGTTVRQLLRSTTYIGQHVCSGIVVPCPAIIDQETFHAVQRMSEENRRRLVGRPSNKYLLRSFLWCAKCGRRCISNPGTKATGKDCPVYLCGNVEYKPYRRICHAPRVPCAKIEAEAWDAIWRVLTEPSLLLRLGQAYYAAMKKPEGGAETLEGELARLRAKRETIGQMMEDGLTPYAKGREKIRACDQRIRQIEQELAVTGRVVSLPPARAAEAYLREVTGGAEPTTYAERRDILEGILDLRMTYYDGDLTIEGKVPVPDRPAAASGSGQKNRHRRIRADPERERRDRRDGEARGLAPAA
jgi:site-specific DNA recombinase